MLLLLLLLLQRKMIHARHICRRFATLRCISSLFKNVTVMAVNMHCI